MKKSLLTMHLPGDDILSSSQECIKHCKYQKLSIGNSFSLSLNFQSKCKEKGMTVQIP